MFSPTRGGYVPIPAEYRSWRVVPASHFIDPMMRYLDNEYYVEFLSAAEVHGAAESDSPTNELAATKRGTGRTSWAPLASWVQGPGNLTSLVTVTGPGPRAVP